MPGTALVLGGGGPVGGAWLTGVPAGLAEAGINPGSADVVIGTSAGAGFGTRLRSGVPASDLYERQLSGADAVRLPVTARQTVRFLWAALGSRDPQRSIERLSQAALHARTGPESDVFDTVGALLGYVRDWPERELRIAAVDARSEQTEMAEAERLRALPPAEGARQITAKRAAAETARQAAAERARYLRTTPQEPAASRDPGRDGPELGRRGRG